MHVSARQFERRFKEIMHCTPKEIQAFTTGCVYEDEAHRSFVQGGGHGGSHPHLAHNLLMAVLGRRAPYPNAVQAANITCAGILSHQSALRGGEKMYLPEWTFMPKNKPHVVELNENVQPPCGEQPQYI